MAKSIYISALEYGQQHLFDGVKYSDVKKHVEKEHKTEFDYYSEKAFLGWFIEAFSSVQNYTLRDNMLSAIDKVLMVQYLNKKIDISNAVFHYEIFCQDVKFFITGESDRKLLEYRELQEARSSARQAFWTAIGAIIVSVIGVFTAPFIQYWVDTWLNSL